MLNESAPLTPAVPEAAVFTMILPLSDTELVPEARTTDPPTELPPTPATIEIEPAEEEVEDPVCKLIDPLTPLVAAPVDIEKEPLLPALDVPVLKMSAPLTPWVPELGVAMVTLPLLV